MRGTEVDAMKVPRYIIRTPSRRRFLRSAGILGGIAATFPAWADTYIDLDLPGGPDRRELTTDFPQKAQMIVQRTCRPAHPSRGNRASGDQPHPAMACRFRQRLPGD